MTLLIILIACLGIRLLYWIVIFRPLAYHHTPNSSQASPVTIITCVKDAYFDLPFLLDCLAIQAYDSEIEIIVVDDYSTHQYDELKEKYASVKWVKPDKDRPGKKEAILAGVAAASYDLLLFTDADCRPSEMWVQCMTSSQGQSDIVLGYSPMIQSTTFISRLARYETFMTALQYLGLCLRGLPYMGVGRNMLVQRSVYQEHNIYEGYESYASGDDDILIQYAAKSKLKISINTDEESFVYTKSPKTFQKYIRQKSRHVTTSATYALKHQIILFIFAAVHIGSIGLLLASFFLTSYDLGIYIFLIYWIVARFGFSRLWTRLVVGDLKWRLPIIDIFMAGVYVLVSLISIKNFIFQKPKTWS